MGNNSSVENGSDQIVKSTFIMGSSSVINIVLGIIRHKIIAVLISSAGIGLLGIFQSLSNLFTTIFGMGINESGARKIAILFERDKFSLSEIYLSIKRIALLTGFAGVAIVSIFSPKLSILSFKDPSHSLEIIFLSLTILLGNIFGAQTALIQGARKINYLAKINILGPLWGTLISLPLIYYFKMRAVVSYLIIMSFTNVLSSRWYSKKIDIPQVRAGWKTSIKQSAPLIGLGSTFMIGAIIGVASSYILRILIVRILGLEAAGIFQASTIFSSVYVGILLKAMATDFYPRLSAISDDNVQCSRLVNDQTEVGLLLGLPGVLFTLTFSSFLMVAFYSKDFLPGVDVLRWQILGVMLQVITWPMGYVLRAKAAGKLFILTEFLYNASYLIFGYLGMKLFGLRGIGISFFLSNLFYFLLIYPIVHRLFNIKLTKHNVVLLTAVSLTAIAALTISWLIPRYYLLLNVPLIICTAFYTYKKLNMSDWLNKVRRSIK
jgi:PST family polysaccharide transporter